MKAILSTVGVSVVLVLTGCGGSSGGGGGPTGDSDGAASLAALLATGTNSSDTSVQWNCDGNDGTDAVSFVQRLFADGTGRIEMQSSPASEFTWSAASATAYSVTFPSEGVFPEEVFSITDVSFSDVNLANDQYDGVDSRNGTALSCTKSQVSVNPPTSAPTIDQQLTLAANLDENSQIWECGDTDYIFLGDGSVVIMDNGGDFTRSWEVTAANSLVVSGIGGFAWNQIDFSSDTGFTAVEFGTNEPVSCSLIDLMDIQPMVATCPAFVVDDFNEVDTHEFFPDNPQGSPASLTGSVVNDLGAFCQSSDSFTAGGGQVFSAEGLIRNGGGLGPTGSIEGTFIYSFYRNVTGNFVDGSQEKEIGNEVEAPFKVIGTFEEAQACSRELLGCTNF